MQQAILKLVVSLFAVVLLGCQENTGTVLSEKALNPIKFIEISNLLEEIHRKVVLAEDLNVNLEKLLFLDTALEAEINYIAPSYLSQYFNENELEAADFILTEADKKKLILTSEHKSIEALITNSDSSLNMYLKRVYGINRQEVEIFNNQVYVLDNKAIVVYAVTSQGGGYYTFVFELVSPKILSIGLIEITVV